MSVAVTVAFLFEPRAQVLEKTADARDIVWINADLMHVGVPVHRLHTIENKGFTPIKADQRLQGRSIF